MYITTFTVKLRGAASSLSFPIDMLRYDACYPADFDGAHDIAATAHEYHTDREDTEIVLAHRDSDKSWKPTVGRWESFGWTVSNLMTPQKV